MNIIEVPVRWPAFFFVLFRRVAECLAFVRIMYYDVTCRYNGCPQYVCSLLSLLTKKREQTVCLEPIAGNIKKALVALKQCVGY